MITDDLSTTPDDRLLTEIDLIEENIQVCGRNSSYTHRNRPVLKALLMEAERRGLEVP